MYDYQAKRMAKVLNARVPGKLSASTGPGATFVILRIERWPLQFNAKFMGEEIETHVLSDDGRGVVWGTRQYPNTVEGAERAAGELVSWLHNLAPAATTGT